MPIPDDHPDRMERARLSLDGLSIGDAFGERFFDDPRRVIARIQDRTMPRPPWTYTDDTEMALAVVEVLERHGAVEQDELARVFADRYRINPTRGYGAAAHTVLGEIGAGRPWKEASKALFGGQGSKGNGAAMRVAPIGGYFADDIVEALLHADASAAITHSHPEGRAGAVAVAAASSYAWSHRHDPKSARGAAMLDYVVAYTPRGATRDRLIEARKLPGNAAVAIAASALGSGVNVTSEDTVPFAIWCAARHLEDFQECLWTTVAGLGDRDTTCAIAGGIVALSAGRYSIPPAWLAAREPLR